MKRFFGDIDREKAYIRDDEFQHLKSVLRMKEGDEIIVIDGSEIEYKCQILSLKKDYAEAVIISSEKCKKLPCKNITLFQAMIKREKFEEILQKSVELGILNFIPFESEYCAVKDYVAKKDRLEKIVKGACKQCECSKMMNISDPVKFDDMIKCACNNDIILFANERDGEKFDFSKLKNYKNIAIIIGPEGGFSDIEKKKIISAKAESISLGNRILRSETAAITLMGITSVLSEN